MLIELILLFLGITVLAYFMDIAGLKNVDRTYTMRVVGVAGLSLLLIATFGELLHASSTVSIYIGDLTPLQDNTVPTLFLSGSALMMLSAYKSKQRLTNTGKTLTFCFLVGLLAIVNFFLIAFSAM